jgi:hypothetical protein
VLCQGVAIARSGDQEYAPHELADFAGVVPEGLKIKNGRVIVHRPAEEVFSPRTMASFEGAPICGPSHPPQFITPTNWRAWSSGHCQNVRRGPMLPDASGQALVADLIVRDAPLAETVLSGETRAVSAGYDTVYETEADGSLTQRCIVANHVAILRGAGRAGPAVAIQDHAVPHATLEDVLTKFGNVLARCYQRFPDMRPAVLRELKDLALIPAPAQAMDAAVTDAESYAAQMRKLWRRAR